MVADTRFIREKQPKGAAAIEYSVNKMIELILKDRTDPAIVAFSRRALRDAGLVGQDKQDPVKVNRAIWDAINKQGIGWVPDPIRAEFLAAPRHFIESEPGKDDALMVCGDCDELTMLQVCIALCCLLSVGVETSSLILHSYNPGKTIQHVLSGVYDRSAGQWIRVDHTYSDTFGAFQQPTHEIMISMPSGRVICNATSCTRATPAAVEDGSQWDHGRLEGIPQGDGPVVLSGLFSDDADEETRATFGEILDLNEWDLMDAVRDFEASYSSLLAFFDRMDFSFAEREVYWPAEREAEADNALFAAEVVQNAIHETRIGARPWAIDEDGNYALLRNEDEHQAIDSGGSLINVLSGTQEPMPPDALGELPLPPWAIVGLAAGAILVTVGGFWALVQVIRSLADMARSAEIRASTDVVAQCLKNNDAERCAKLGKSVAQIRSSREEAEADKAKAEAEKAKEETKQILAGLAVAGVVAAGGVFVYLGGPAIVSGWLASRKKAA